MCQNEKVKTEETTNYLYERVKSLKDNNALITLCTLMEVAKTQHKKAEDLKKELNDFKAGTLLRFKNDCVNIFVSQHKQDREDMIEYMNCLSDEEYFEYMSGELSTEDYCSEDISNWD